MSSIEKLKEDLEMWMASELEVKKVFEQLWFKVKLTSDTDILDFELSKDWVVYHSELKTRRVEKDKYPTTLIWANKIAEAYKRYYTSWEQTLFLFLFTDWLYWLNPFKTLPAEIEYKKFRWDRGNIDKPKWWCLYDVNSLSLFYKM